MFVLQLQDLKKGNFFEVRVAWYKPWFAWTVELFKYMLKLKTFQGCDEVYGIILKTLP